MSFSTYVHKNSRLLMMSFLGVYEGGTQSIFCARHFSMYNI